MKLTTVGDVIEFLDRYPRTMPITINCPVGDVPIQILKMESDRGNYLVVTESPVEDGLSDHCCPFRGTPQ